MCAIRTAADSCVFQHHYAVFCRFVKSSFANNADFCRLLLI